jgi:hypothetical protein
MPLANVGVCVWGEGVLASYHRAIVVCSHSSIAGVEYRAEMCTVNVFLLAMVRHSNLVPSPMLCSPWTMMHSAS